MPAIFITLVLILFSNNSFATGIAAHIVALSGHVQATTADESIRDLKKGDAVYAEEFLITDKNSSVKLLFIDGSKFELGSETSLEISQYNYNEPNQADSFSTRILKGTFRFVTGLIAKNNPHAMDVNLPVATIGIRGTHVVGEVTPTSAKVILLKPEKPHPTAVEVYNQFGSVTIDKTGYGTEIPDEFSPPSPIRRMKLGTVNNLMRSIQGVQRIRMPNRPRI